MYNPIPDLAIFGALLLSLVATIRILDKRRPAPYRRYHMVDQAGRYGK